MKRKNWEELRSLSQVELEAKLRDINEKLFRLRFQHSSTQLKSPLEIRNLRRNIARIKTLLNEKKVSPVN